MAEFEKVSVTLPKDLVESARARVGSGALSAYIADALRLHEHRADLDEFLAAHVAEHGPIPDDIMEEVRRTWPDPRVAARDPRTSPRRRSSSTAKG